MDNGAQNYRRFLDGDENAFDDLMRELFPSLVFFLYRYVHDIYTAEDLAMDAFSDLIVHRHRYNFKVTLKTYLFMIGRSRAIDYLRSRRPVNFSALSLTPGLIPDEEETVRETLLAKERAQAVHAALAALPEEMREAVYLIYFEELSYAETARVMKKNRKQVDNLLYRAKKALRELLGEDGASL